MTTGRTHRQRSGCQRPSDSSPVSLWHSTRCTRWCGGCKHTCISSPVICCAYLAGTGLPVSLCCIAAQHHASHAQCAGGRERWVSQPPDANNMCAPCMLRATHVLPPQPTARGGPCIYRDLKLPNVVYDGRSGLFGLIDFGLMVSADGQNFFSGLSMREPSAQRMRTAHPHLMKRGLHGCRLALFIHTARSSSAPAEPSVLHSAPLCPTPSQ